MAETLDLNILTLYRKDGQDLPSLPGLYLATAPRRAVRNRSSDGLLLYLSLTGNVTLPNDQLEKMLAKLAQSYYKISGSVTSAMHSLAETLNLSLLERNLQATGNNLQGTGIFTIAVLRNARLSLAHCGPTHTFVIGASENQHFYDPQNNRGLGITRSISIRYYQVELQSNDLLVITANPPSGWPQIIQQRGSGLGLESLRRRLISQAGTDASAILIQAQSGMGKIRLLRVKPQAVSTQLPSKPEAELPSEEAQETVDQPLPTEPQADLTAPAVIPEPEVTEPPVSPTEESEPNSTHQIQAMPAPVSTISSSSPQERIHTGIATAGVIKSQDTTATPQAPVKEKPIRETAKQQPQEPKSISQRTLRTAFSGFFLAIGHGFGKVFRAVLSGLTNVTRRILPDKSIYTIPATTMLFIALAVPIILVIAGGAIYYQRGRNQLYQSNYQQAALASENAAAQSDPLEIRTGWETVLDYLDEAEKYRKTSESEALRTRAQFAIDQLDTIIRLDYKPAITGGLGEAVQVSGIVASDDHLYLLHSSGEKVDRAIFMGSAYEIDTSFVCGITPGTGPMIDILPAPKDNNINATVMMIDIHGNLLYCITDETPMSSALKPPATNWGEIKAFAMDGTDLYILDPPNNAVWVYYDMQIDQTPHLYFGKQIPPMQDTIDLAVTRGELYLLHSDGHITKCTGSIPDVSPTRCDDPANYTDNRPGRSSGPLILDAQFSQIQYTPPPDPSIYLLSPIYQAVYHFSLKLNFQRQFRPQDPISDDPATAFTIGPNRTIYLAVGNQVYFANLP